MSDRQLCHTDSSYATDNTLTSQHTSLQYGGPLQPLQQRPHTAPPPHSHGNHSLRDVSSAQQPHYLYSPSAIAQLLSEAGLNISLSAPQHEQGAALRAAELPASNVHSSPTVGGNEGWASHARGIAAQPSRYESAAAAAGADTSMNSSERSVHFASPVHVMSYVPNRGEDYMQRNGNGGLAYSHSPHRALQHQVSHVAHSIVEIVSNITFNLPN